MFCRTINLFWYNRISLTQGRLIFGCKQLRGKVYKAAFSSVRPIFDDRHLSEWLGENQAKTRRLRAWFFEGGWHEKFAKNVFTNQAIRAVLCKNALGVSDRIRAEGEDPFLSQPSYAPVYYNCKMIVHTSKCRGLQ